MRTNPDVTDDDQSLWRWREESLIALGLDKLQAELLMEKTDVVREVEALLAKGCPVELVYRILH